MLRSHRDNVNEERQRLVNTQSEINNSSYGAATASNEGMAEPSQQNGLVLPQYLAAIAATGGALAAGSVFGWSSPAEIPAVNQTAYGFSISNEEWSWVGSSATLGAALICLIIGLIIDRIGRKRTMLLLILPFTIGWSMIIWPTNIYMLYAGRFLLGLAGGAFFVTAPIYIGEIASKEVRGKLSSYFQLMVTCGILFVYAVGYFFTIFTYNILCAIIPLIFGLIFAGMPETPHYWIMRNKPENAIKSIKWLRGTDYDYHNDLDEICVEHEAITQRQTSLLNAMLTVAMKRAIIISLSLMFFLQLSGINAVIFYTGFIFDAAKTGIDGSLATIIVGLMQVIATFVASLSIDRLGRRILLLTSISIMCICNIILGLYFYLLDNYKSSIEQFGWLPILSLCIYIIAYSLGLGPIPWVLIGELFTTEVKGAASSISGSVAWLLAFLVTKTFTNVRDAIGLGETFWIFAVFSIIGAIFVWAFVPETKGKSFANIQKMLSGLDVENENENTTQTAVII